MQIVKGGPEQGLLIFQMAPIPILSVPTCSTSSPHDIMKFSRKKSTITHLLGGTNVMIEFRMGLIF
jgi:hypothetical protein